MKNDDQLVANEANYSIEEKSGNIHNRTINLMASLGNSSLLPIQRERHFLFQILPKTILPCK